MSGEAKESDSFLVCACVSLSVFLSVLLVGMALWWWREEFRPSTSLTEQSFSLKESQDPLIIPAPNTCRVKARKIYAHAHTHTHIEIAYTGTFIHLERGDTIHSAADV